MQKASRRRQPAFSAADPQSDLRAACEGVDLVIDAIPEQMELKVRVLGEVRQHAPGYCVIGSNTSSLSITEIGTRIGAPGLTVGLHFFNPPPVMELLEVVRGLGTGEATLATSLALATRLGKTSIVVNDTPGFATSRLGVAIGAEAMRSWRRRASTRTSMRMELGYRHPMGSQAPTGWPRRAPVHPRHMQRRSASSSDRPSAQVVRAVPSQEFGRWFLSREVAGRDSPLNDRSSAADAGARG